MDAPEPAVQGHERDDWCEHWVERDACVFCTNPGADVRDGFCPNHEPSSTWHVVDEDGTARCCACGHVHEYRPGYLERNRG